MEETEIVCTFNLVQQIIPEKM